MNDEVPEPWIESVIQRAADRGEFDDLPLSGQPMPILDEDYSPGWWVRRLVERERAAARLSSDSQEIGRESSHGDSSMGLH